MSGIMREKIIDEDKFLETWLAKKGRSSIND